MFVGPLKTFKNEQSGSIAIVMALTFTAVVTLAGGVVDYVRWTAARGETVQAMDAAVLAGGRQMLLNKTNDEAIQAAQRYYDQNKSKRLFVDSVTFTIDGSKIVATSNSSVKTAFLPLAGIPELPIRETTQAIVEAGANGGQNVEIAMMLDTTGSMAGTKMVALKQAAIDLVDIVVWDDQSEFQSRVAVVPFARYVNVGRDAFEIATDYSPPGNSDNRTCVKERQGTHRYTDETPNGTNGYFDYYTGTRACQPQATVLPLTNDTQDLRQRINEMQPIGTTAGHIGSAWAWYALSPNFSGLWPAASEPQSYSKLTELNERGLPSLKKIAILMTDGEYNKKYSGDSSAIQARAICAAMKAKGVTVYTVGFAISPGGEAAETMEQCATDSDHSYSADDPDALRAAFRDIALKIATLRLTQ